MQNNNKHILILLCGVLVLAGLLFFVRHNTDTIPDPFDPALGPRNPRPGAEQYLASRNDISAAEKQALLYYKPCSLAILEMLADAPSREVRALVAINPSVNEAVLTKLLNDADPSVRQYVAGNPRAPHSILLKLQADPDGNVQWSLQHNPNWAASSTQTAQ